MGTAQVRVMNLNTPVSEACASASASGSGPLTPVGSPNPRPRQGNGGTQSRWQAQALTATLPGYAGGTRLGATGRSDESVRGRVTSVTVAASGVAPPLG
jgi:hypothetical protein